VRRSGSFVQREGRGMHGQHVWRDVAVADLTAEEIQRWRQLAHEAVEPNFCLDPRFLMPAVAHHPYAAGMRAVIVEREGRMVGFLAYARLRPWRYIPLSLATTATPFLNDHADRHHPLVAAQNPAEIVDAILAALRRRGMPLWAQLRFFPSDGVLAEALAHQRSLLVENQFQSAVDRSVGSPSGTPSVDVIDIVDAADHLSASRRKSLRRRMRSLEREAGAPITARLWTPDSGTLTDFLNFQASGWKGDRSRGGEAFLLDPVDASWFSAMMQGFIDDGDARAISLTCADRLLYLALSVRSGAARFGFIDSMDDDFSRFGVGTIGRIVEMMLLRSESTPRLPLDPALGAGADQSAAIYPDRRSFADVWVARQPWLHAARHPLTVADDLLARVVRLYRSLRHRVAKTVKPLIGRD